MHIDIGLGEILALLSAVTWAIGVILYRQLVRDLAPLTLNFIKNALVLVMLLPLPWLLHGNIPAGFSVTEILITLGSGLLGIAIADTLYFVALARLGAGRMGILGNAYSPLVILLSVWWLGERLHGLQIAGFLLVMAGVLVIAYRQRTPPAMLGEAQVVQAAPDPVAAPALASFLIGIGAVILMAVAIVMIKPVLEARPLGWVTLLRLLGALAGMIVIALLRGELHTLSPRGLRINWKLLILAAFIGQCLSMVFWLGGYKYAPASVAAILNETASVFILLLAWWWLREPLGRRGLIGVSLTLGGVILMLLA